MGTATHHGHHGHEHDHHHDHGGAWSRLRHAVVHAVVPHSHDAGASVADALEATAEGVRAVRLSLLVLGVAAAVQALLVVVTGSVALLADTIHNASDALTAVPLWIAFTLGRRPATRRHTYGLGRSEDLAGVLIVLTIAASAVVAGYESLRRLADPRPLESPWVVVAAGVIGFAANELVAALRMRAGRRIGSAALVADGQHARVDGFTSLAVVVGALGALAGFERADAVVGLAIAVAIVAITWHTSRDVLGRLLDAVDPADVQRVEHALAGTPGVLGHEAVRMRWIGHRLRAEVAVHAAAGLDLAHADRLAEAIEERLRADVPRLEEVAVRVRVSPGPASSPVR